MKTGKVIGLARRAVSGTPMEELQSVLMTPELGVMGDCKGQKWPKRGVTILARDDWDAALQALDRGMGPPDLPWTARRANVFIDGASLPKGDGSVIALGAVLLEVTDETFPCHKMDLAHPGLLSALSGNWRGGVTCRVVSGGSVEIGDEFRIIRHVTQRQAVLPG